MKGIKGQLSSLSITDLMQWIDMNKKTGVLFVSSDTQNVCFCFEEGRLLMSSAREEGLRFGDFIVSEGYVPPEKMRESIKGGLAEGTSFIGFMVEKKLLPAEFMKVSIEHLAEKFIMDILAWEEGSFQFVEDLPKVLNESPIKLGINFITFEAVRKHDEMLKAQGGH
jgi:hypothetical protein